MKKFDTAFIKNGTNKPTMCLILDVAGEICTIKNPHDETEKLVTTDEVYSLDQIIKELKFDMQSLKHYINELENELYKSNSRFFN